MPAICFQGTFGARDLVSTADPFHRLADHQQLTHNAGEHQLALFSVGSSLRYELGDIGACIVALDL